MHTGNSPVEMREERPLSRVSSTTTTRTLTEVVERDREIEAKLSAPNQPYDDVMAAKLFTPPQGDEVRYQLQEHEEIDIDTELNEYVVLEKLTHGCQVKEDYENQRKKNDNPYSNILEFEDELPKNKPPPKASRVGAPGGSFKPLAAGVKGKIKVPEEEAPLEVNQAELKSPVYATVKKEWKRPDSRSSQVSQNPKYAVVTKASDHTSIANHVRPVDNHDEVSKPAYEKPKMVLLEDEGHNINVREQQRKQRKLSFGFSLKQKKKKKRQSMKNLISSPVGEVVHTDGHASPDILKTLGVGREQEGARLTTLPRPDSRNGVADIVSYEEKKSASEDDYSDPTLHHSMFVDAKTKQHKSKKNWVNVPVNVDIVEYTKDEKEEEDSFSDPTLHPNLLLRGEPMIPDPVEDVDFSLAPPTTFADHEIESQSTKDLVFSLDTYDDIHMRPQTPVKKEKKRVKREKTFKKQISKDVISYPVVSSLVQEVGN